MESEIQEEESVEIETDVSTRKVQIAQEKIENAEEVVQEEVVQDSIDANETKFLKTTRRGSRIFQRGLQKAGFLSQFTSCFWC